MVKNTGKIKKKGVWLIDFLYWKTFFRGTQNNLIKFKKFHKIVKKA
jgi:hypothetical protein